MPDGAPSDVKNALSERTRALSRWDSEGGAGPSGPQSDTNHMLNIPDLTNAELVQLRVRVIAIENLLIALLAQVSDRQIELAREMATFISPRPDSAQHPLTIHAAGQMNDLIHRAGHFRNTTPS